MIANRLLFIQKRKAKCHFCLFVLWMAVIFLPVFNSSAEEPASSSDITTEQKLSLIEIYTWSHELPKALIDLKRAMDGFPDISHLEETLPVIEKQTGELEWEATSLKSNPNITGHDITLFETKLIKIGTKLENISDAVSFNISKLELLYKDWIAKKEKFSRILNLVEEESGILSALPNVDIMTEQLETAKEMIENRLGPNLIAGHSIGQVQTRIYELNEVASTLMRDRNEIGTQQTSPSMLSAEFYDEIDAQQFSNGLQNIRIFFNYQWRYVKENYSLVTSSLSIICILALLILFSRKLVKPSFIWYPFAASPVISAFFIFNIACSIAYIFSANINLPPGWATLIYLPLLAAVGYFVDNICKTPWQTVLLRQLIFYTCLTIVFTVIGVPPVLFYLFVFYASTLLLFYYIARFIKRWLRGNKQITWAVTMWGAFPVGIIVVGASGYDQLAVMLFGKTLALVAITLTIAVQFLFMQGLFELCVSLIPLNFINKNTGIIVKRVTPILALLHIILWLASVLTVLWIFPTLNTAFNAMTSLEFSFFSATITPESVLTVIVIVYSTILFSSGIQAFLLQEVLPRHNVEKGVQISISRLVHYAILLVGFIILLRILGFGLSQITILGGALGVGIGFGLQAIVNNFVSGLILLYERPVKVGDFIEIGSQVGEVKELGLRATTVQTFDNAEIVIPNSQLITDSVTNWTLAEKKVRVRIPVGVAYGTDVEKVLKILLSCAEVHPRVLSTPKSTALFLAFGESSLDFELRAWIPDFDDKLVVLSELNQDIEAEFQLAAIEIPFPQRDLHLRSVDSETMKTVLREKSNLAGKSL